jgi:rare lipoprotein A
LFGAAVRPGFGLSNIHDYLDLAMNTGYLMPYLNRGKGVMLKNLLNFIKLGLCSLLLCLLFGCSATQPGSIPPQFASNANSNHPPDAVPKKEEYSRHGNAASYTVQGERYYVLKSAEGYDKTGIASWYGTKFHGRLTSNRETYDMYAMTAASPNLPIPSYVHVTNLSNGKTAVVRVNDRGPFKSGRIIDLSYAAAKKLGYIDQGTAKVRVTGIDATNKQTVLASQRQHNESVKALMAGKTPITTHTALAENTTRPVYLQVGAFRQKYQAEDLRREVAGLTNMQASVKAADNNGPIYLVNIGPIADTQSAKVKTVLAQNGYEKPFEVGG